MERNKRRINRPRRVVINDWQKYLKILDEITSAGYLCETYNQNSKVKVFRVVSSKGILFKIEYSRYFIMIKDLAFLIEERWADFLERQINK